MGKHESRVADGIVKRGNRYSVRYRRPDGTQTRKAFRTLEEARRFKRDTDASILTGHFIDPKRREVTMATWLDDDYIPSMRGIWSPEHGDSQVALIDKHIRPTFGSRTIASVRHIDVQKWANGLIEAGYKANTIARYFNTLNAIFGSAVRNGVLPKNPCEDTKLPKVSKAVENVLSPADVMRIAAAVPDRFELAVWLGAMAGMRLGEILGLTLDRVDFEARTIRIDRQWSRSGRFSMTKTRKPRTVPVGDDLLARIRAHVAAYGVTRAGTLFGRTEAPIAHTNFYSAVWKPVRKLGLPADADSPHALRHFYASVLIDKRCSPKEVQERLGHATISQTMDTYTHLFESADDRTRDAFAGVFAPKLTAVAS